MTFTCSSSYKFFVYSFAKPFFCRMAGASHQFWCFLLVRRRPRPSDVRLSSSVWVKDCQQLSFWHICSKADTNLIQFAMVVVHVSRNLMFFAGWQARVIFFNDLKALWLERIRCSCVCFSFRAENPACNILCFCIIKICTKCRHGCCQIKKHI